MKKLISVFCVLTVLLTVLAVGLIGADAATAAKTIVDVKKGDTVTYYLYLSGCKENVICADYSVYYDPSVLRVDAVADYNNSFDEDEVESIINTDRLGEINANFIKIGKGVNFANERTFIGVKFTAIADGSSHISYYIRDMAGNSYFDNADKPEITEYLFTCKVSVNSSTILEDAQPELNTEEPQAIGGFVNSVNGRSEDADFVASEQNSGGSGNNGNSGNSGSSGNADNATDPANPDTDATTATEKATDPTDTADDTQAATAQPASTTEQNNSKDSAKGAGKTTGTEAEAEPESGSSSAWIWIVIIAVVVLGGGGAAAYLLTGKKKKNNPGE